MFPTLIILLSPLVAPIQKQKPVENPLPVIPAPYVANPKPGYFELESGLAVRFDARLANEARLLAAELGAQVGSQVFLVDTDGKESFAKEIHLAISKDLSNPESYYLDVKESEIRVGGSDAAGVFYGMQTLLQTIDNTHGVRIPAYSILDKPRFAWRGLHLDVGRHYFPKEDIKKLLHWMSVHKLNRFHWHLTEDQGWRLEIKKYPKLTEIGSIRASTPPYGDRGAQDGVPYGGFYTQEDVREIVEYAKQLHIEVVPEIDMPGHMAAAIAAYPELGNSDIEGYEPAVQTRWGVHPYVLAPKEETFAWIDDVLTEVCDLFPYTYIHIGGDEAPKGQWKQSAFAQQVMQREGLANEEELQAYFLSRVSKMLEARGRKLLGWDEIREGGLAKGATVMVWRGWHNAVEAANEGHDVVMAPTSHTYLDYYQNDPKLELAKGKSFECIGGHLPLEKVYSMEPVPEELRGTDAEKHILGCQAQLWTEYMKTWDKVEYLAFPRVSALAEVAWTHPANRDFTDFQRRLKPLLKRMQAAGVRCYDPFASVLEPEEAQKR